jgi:hypothetical protein
MNPITPFSELITRIALRVIFGSILVTMAWFAFVLYEIFNGP